jgi:hypothetical protein
MAVLYGPKWKEVEDKFFPQRNSIPQKKLLENGDGRSWPLWR